MAILNSTFVELYADVGRAVYFAEVASLSAAQLANVKRWGNDGYAMFLRARAWSFLSPKTTFTLWPTITTPALTATTVTLTSATDCFYPTVVGRSITATAGATYTINGYTSAKVVTVTATAAADTGKVFTITATGDYGMVDGFKRFAGRPTYQSEDAPYRLRERTADWIRFRRAQVTDSTADPTDYAIEPRAFTVTLGQQWDLLVYPIPSEVRVMDARIGLDPQEMSADAEYPLGGPDHSQTILQAALAIAESRTTQGSGHVQLDRYRAVELPDSIRRDIEQEGPIIGQMRPREESPVDDYNPRLFTDANIT